MTPAGWILAALSTMRRQTATEIVARVPSAAATHALVVEELHRLVDEGKAVRHPPDGGQGEATYTRAVS